MSPDDELDPREGAPEDEAASAEETEQAAAFANFIDTLVAGDSLPAVMGADERALVDTAAILRANLRTDEQVTAGVPALVDQVMSRVVTEAGAKQARSEAMNRASEEAADPGIIDLARRRRRRRRLASFGIVAAAAAAALVFVLRTPPPTTGTARVSTELSMSHRSRSADALIGQIPRAKAGQASDRIDTIYADRMAGYRDLQFIGGTR